VTASALRDDLLQRNVHAVAVSQRAGVDFPSLATSASTAAGIVGIQLGSEWLVLLRGQVKRQVAWAGNPREIKRPDQAGHFTPRTNFEPWMEEITGESEPWPEETEELAMEIRAGLLEIIQRRNITLARTNGDLRRFAGTVAHEVKNHLQTGIMALALVGEDSSGSFPPPLLEIASLGRERLEGLSNFVDELLAFSKTDISSSLTVIDLNLIAEEAVRELEISGLSGNARVVISPLPKVWGHETQLRHVIGNLLRNALIHARDGHQVLNIEIGSRPDPDAGVIFVRDDGRGIPTGQREKIFDYFFRGAAENGGSGIGLAFCYQALERMGQRIWVEDVAPRGSAFCFTVRIADTD
ncbi:MAG: hypothetical protein EOP85_03295, partial [Verrucomicrobiaceae bacterium]